MLKISRQLSSAAIRDSMAARPCRERIASGFGAGSVARRSIPGISVECLGDRQNFRLLEGIGNMTAKAQIAAAGRGNRACEKPHAILDQSLVGLARTVPFEHGEFRMVKPAPFAVPENMREAKNALLAGGEQFLGREFGRACR